MQILRNEVRTGLLVLVTLGLVVSAVLYISSPGLFRPLKKLDVYFDNAAGIKPGAAVIVAGACDRFYEREPGIRSGRTRREIRRDARTRSRGSGSIDNPEA